MAVGRPPLSFMLRKPPRQDFPTDGNQVIIEVRGYPRLFDSPAFSFLPPTLPFASASPRAGDQQGPPQSGSPSGDPPRQGSRVDTSSVPISHTGKLRLGERKQLAQGHILTPMHLENKD